MEQAGASFRAPLGGRRERILVVDDQEMLRTVIRRVLAHGGYEVVEARDGGDALDLHQEGRHTFDLVLLDVHMPGLSGRETLARMRETDPGLPALFLSGALEDCGMDGSPHCEKVDFLPKPFENHELLRKVREILDE